MATLFYNGKRYDLPKKTMAIVEKEDLMHTKSASLVEAYQKQFDYIKALFSEEVINDIFGTSDLDEIDMTELTLVCNMVHSAYMQKIVEHQKKESEMMANNKALEKIISVGKSVEKMMEIKNK